MACEGSKEVGVTGTASASYNGPRFGISSIVANIVAHMTARSRLEANITTEKSTICDGICEEDGCKCEVSDFENPTAFNNPSVSWVATATGWLGISTAGRYTVTYAYIVKGECVEAD